MSGKTGTCPDKCEWCGSKCSYARYHSKNKKCNCGNHPEHPLENLKHKEK